MIFLDPLPFVQLFVAVIDIGIKEHTGKPYGLTKAKRCWLSFCLMGVMLTNSICWTRFERVCLGNYRASALSWMFRRSKRMPWDLIFQASIGVILHSYGINDGVLVIDDSDKKRSKKTKRIPFVHKMKDKSSGGFMMGQGFVLLLLVTKTITFPVGVAIYQPDPVRSKWVKDDKEMKEKGIPKKNRPVEPPKNSLYPTKIELGLKLLIAFKKWHDDINVKAILADALYNPASFVNTAQELFPGAQIISQLRSNQNIKSRNRILPVEEYFRRHPDVSFKLQVRGGEKINTFVKSARIHVCSHKVKRFVIAVKYEDETAYRYLFASDLSWRTEDILNAYTLRWLIEVFFQDWKGNEGWGNLTKLQGVEGSSHGLILSLLVDHCLLCHPAQLAQLKQNKPAFTVGSLINTIKVESIVSTIRSVLISDNPEQKLAEIADTLVKLFPLKESEKHMAGRELGRLEPSPSLKYRAMVA